MATTNERRDRIQKVIEQLNALGVGDISALQTRLGAIEQDLESLGIDALRGTVADARAGLDRGEVSEFRRLVSQAASKLGHLRSA